MTTVPGWLVAGNLSTRMQSLSKERESRSAIDLVRDPSFSDSVSTLSLLQIPKFAKAPIPKVPTTPAERASSVFFPLAPARQKLFWTSAKVIPIPLSSTLISRFEIVTEIVGAKFLDSLKNSNQDCVVCVLNVLA